MGMKVRIAKANTVTSSGLDFFNALSATLQIQLSEVPKPMSDKLRNRAAARDAVIRSVRLEPSVFLREEGAFRDLTAEELELVVLKTDSILMRGLAEPVFHQAPNDSAFTVADLLSAVEETERTTRATSNWFDGIDTHHVFFEGIYQHDGVWTIHWGS